MTEVGEAGWGKGEDFEPRQTKTANYYITKWVKKISNDDIMMCAQSLNLCPTL